MRRDDDIDWSIDEDAFDTTSPAGATSTPTEPAAAGQPAAAGPLTLRLSRRATLAVAVVICGALALAWGGTLWQAQIQRTAIEADVRAIDADFQRQGPTALAVLQTRATEQAPEIWLFNQVRLLSQSSAASPLDWPRAVETDAARVTDHRPLGPGLVLATVERSFLNPDGIDGATWRFTTLETYSQTADGGWIRAPMPDFPGRAVTRDRLEGAVRWTFSDLDQATVQEIAPLVDRSLADLCALGLPCPEAGALEVRIVEPGATTATVLWGGLSPKIDASDLIASAISSAGSLNRRHWLTIERLSFADTGMPVGPVEQRALARAITLQLIGRWLVSQYEETGRLNGGPLWGALTLYTAQRTGLIDAPHADPEPLGVYSSTQLWTAEAGSGPAIREALGVLRKALEAEPRADLNALWAELPEARSLPDWLMRGLGWPESLAAERVTDATRPIELEVQAVGALDGILACYDSTLRTTWMGWRRDEVRGIELLDPRVAESLMANGFSARLSPDGRRILLLNGARSLILDVGAGRLVRLPDDVDSSTWQVRWWGNEAVAAPLVSDPSSTFIVSFTDDPPGVTRLDSLLDPFIVSRSGAQALRIFWAGAGNSFVERIDIRLLHSTSESFNPNALLWREYATDRLWSLATGREGVTLAGIQLDPAPGPEPGLLYNTQLPDDDLSPQGFAVDSLHNRAVVSYIDANGLRRLTVIYQLVGLHAFEIARIEQQTGGIPQVGFSPDGAVLYLTNNDALTSSIVAYDVETGGQIGSTSPAYPVTLEDGLTYQLLIGPEGIYLNSGIDNVFGFQRSIVTVWDGRGAQRWVAPPGCTLVASRFRP